MANQAIIRSMEALQAHKAAMVADEAVKPGMLLELTSSGWQKHSTQDGNVPVPAVAPPAEYQTVTTTLSTTSAYANGSYIEGKFVAGAMARLWLAASQTITAGDLLASNGDGLVKEAAAAQAVDEGGSATYTVYTDARIAMALEAVTTGGAENKPIWVIFK